MTLDINKIPEVKRFENFSKDEMQAHAMELTHAVYPHDKIYGDYCTVQDYIDCPPDVVYEYLTNPYHLEEWTYSMRDFGEMDENGLVPSLDKIGGETYIYTKTVVNAEARTVDYHCSWDQKNHLWMIYLMRVVDAQLVFNKPGSVVMWTNCRHPFYDKNPFPQDVPGDRNVWVGDLWPFFYAGHWVELQNLKHILEHKYKAGLLQDPTMARGAA